jgi:hypothetical protein
MNNHWPEATLDELLTDCGTRLLMERDGVEEETVRELLGDVKQARQSEPD